MSADSEKKALAMALWGCDALPLPDSEQRTLERLHAKGLRMPPLDVTYDQARGVLDACGQLHPEPQPRTYWALLPSGGAELQGSIGQVGYRWGSGSLLALLDEPRAGAPSRRRSRAAVMTAGTEGSPEFRVADVAADKARLEYERAFEQFLEDRELKSLDAAVDAFRRLKDTSELMMHVAYFQAYHVHAHSPGAP